MKPQVRQTRGKTAGIDHAVMRHRFHTSISNFIAGSTRGASTLSTTHGD